jgi:plasmid stabilization system protein ParE
MFTLRWSAEAQEAYERVRAAAEAAFTAGTEKRKRKSSKAEGLFKQIHKTLQLLAANPKYPGLQTHPYHSLVNPLDPKSKVFEAYAQQHTPGAYRVFWCYGPEAREITILAITHHP